jgi:hypothetical protein
MTSYSTLLPLFIIANKLLIFIVPDLLIYFSTGLPSIKDASMYPLLVSLLGITLKFPFQFIVAGTYCDAPGYNSIILMLG